MTSIQDIVLIYFEDNPAVYARIEDITNDAKKGWYHVKLLFLQVPLQVVTWILRDRYIDGEEFTMNGTRVRLEKVICPEPDEPEVDETQDDADKKETSNTKKSSKVISFSDLKK